MPAAGTGYWPVRLPAGTVGTATPGSAEGTLAQERRWRRPAVGPAEKLPPLLEMLLLPAAIDAGC